RESSRAGALAIHHAFFDRQSRLPELWIGIFFERHARVFTPHDPSAERAGKLFPHPAYDEVLQPAPFRPGNESADACDRGGYRADRDARRAPIRSRYGPIPYGRQRFRFRIFLRTAARI